jgi:DNA (cytosine-5)-methyltransferase 1
MTAYYSENDENAAAWLEALIAEKLIAPGHVDRRSIVDVRPGDLGGYKQCHFFAGIGGWSLALRYAGWPDDQPVWTGSCPCQPFSIAGKRKGFADARHLWPIWRELIRERHPATVLGEQVASATSWLGLVRSDLEAMDYAVGAMPIQAASAGADHLRDRFWFVAHPNDTGPQRRIVLPERSCERPARPDGVVNASSERRHGSEDPAGPSGRHVPESNGSDLGDTHSERGEPRKQTAAPPRHGDSAHSAGGLDWVTGADGKARRVKSGVRLLVDGFPSRVGLLRGFGNAIDPRPAAAFIGAAREAMTVNITRANMTQPDYIGLDPIEWIDRLREVNRGSGFTPAQKHVIHEGLGRLMDGLKSIGPGVLRSPGPDDLHTEAINPR